MSMRFVLMAAVLAAVAATGVRAEEINPVVGKMTDFVIRESDVDRILASQPPEVQKRVQEDPQLRVNLVREILIKKAVTARARKDGYDRKPEIKEQLSYLIDSYLAQEYLQKVVAAGVTVPEEEVKKFYQEHEKEFVQPEQIKVRHILTAATKDAKPEEREKARARAELALARLKKGEDFAALAREFSDDQNSAQAGGELSVITLGKTNSEEFEKAAFALKKGETSDIVTTAYGFHIIRLDDRQDSRTIPYAEVKEMIQARLKAEAEQKKITEFIEKAVKDAGVEIPADKAAAEKSPEAAKKEEPKK